MSAWISANQLLVATIVGFVLRGAGWIVVQVWPQTGPVIAGLMRAFPEPIAAAQQTAAAVKAGPVDEKPTDGSAT